MLDLKTNFYMVITVSASLFVPPLREIQAYSRVEEHQTKLNPNLDGGCIVWLLFFWVENPPFILHYYKLISLLAKLLQLTVSIFHTLQTIICEQ